MESFLKKIFSGKTDEEVHLEFIKFSRGVFPNKYLLNAKKQPGKWSIKTSAELTNFLVKSCLAKIKGETEVKGVIVSTFDLSKEADIPNKGIKQFMGIKQLKIEDKLASEKILALMERQPRAFYALSFKNSDFELKVKEKAPKSAKPSTKGEAEVKADFCSLKTADEEIVKDLFFDFPVFKEIKVNHTLQIEDIVLPKGEENPVLLRERAVRKGKLIRKVVVDGKENVKEYKLEA